MGVYPIATAEAPKPRSMLRASAMGAPGGCWLAGWNGAASRLMRTCQRSVTWVPVANRALAGFTEAALPAVESVEEVEAESRYLHRGVGLGRPKHLVEHRQALIVGEARRSRVPEQRSFTGRAQREVEDST